MTNHHDVVLILKGGQGWSQTGHDVDVGLSPRVPVAEFVLVTPCELLGETFLHLLVCETLADTLEKMEKIKL